MCLRKHTNIQFCPQVSSCLWNNCKREKPVVDVSVLLWNMVYYCASRVGQCIG